MISENQEHRGCLILIKRNPSLIWKTNYRYKLLHKSKHGILPQRWRFNFEIASSSTPVAPAASSPLRLDFALVRALWFGCFENRLGFGLFSSNPCRFYEFRYFEYICDDLCVFVMIFGLEGLWANCCDVLDVHHNSVVIFVVWSKT